MNNDDCGLNDLTVFGHVIRES